MIKKKPDRMKRSGFGLVRARPHDSRELFFETVKQLRLLKILASLDFTYQWYVVGQLEIVRCDGETFKN